YRATLRLFARRTRTAAIGVRLRPVLEHVVADGRLAHEGLAHFRQAIGVAGAGLTGPACAASLAATVHVNLIAILDRIVARSGLAGLGKARVSRGGGLGGCIGT